MADNRLTALDSSFLHLEDAATHMHVASVMLFEGDPPPYDDLLEHIERRLHLVPRYRQKLAFVPLGQGRPRWVDDPHLNLRYHVRSTALPSPGSEEQLKALASRVFSQQLDRDKPLWEIWLVEGVEGGRFARARQDPPRAGGRRLGRGHRHRAVRHLGRAGGAARSRASAGCRGRSPRGPSCSARRWWSARPCPARPRARSGRSCAARAGSPEQVRDAAVGVGAMAWAGLNPAPESPYNQEIGPHRRFTWVRATWTTSRRSRTSSAAP